MICNRTQILKCIFGTMLLASAAACTTPKDVVYFQDITEPSVTEVPVKTLTLRPNDKLSIIVNSRDRAVADMFNLPFVTRQLGAGESPSVQAQGVSSYTINAKGDIDFPLLGEIHLAGMTRSEAAAYIKGMLRQADLLKDAVVTVELLNGQVSVLGEVTHPGRYAINTDNMTVLDALGAASDLTILGKRENIKVIRTVDGKQETYLLNLLSDKDVRTSPAYYVQQNDVIYVEPNPTRVRQSELNANTVLSTSFWISLASMAITLAAIIAR